MKTEYWILILGGNIMQLPALRIAKRMGWKVILADKNSTVPGKALADFFENVDLKDKEAMCAVAAHYKEQHRLDGVFTAGTDFSATVAFVAEKSGLPGIPYAAALRATDKALMRAAFADHGVPSPGYVRLTAGTDPFTALETLSFPLVIKPVDNMGARGVRRIDRKEDLLPAFKTAIAASRTGNAILEEFMDGPEFSIDALVYQGTITLCGVADRHIFFPPYFVEMGHTMPTALKPEALEALTAVFKQGVRALGITEGAAKGDIFLTSTGAKIGEIAARLSGGYMSGWTYPYASGIEPTEAALKIAVGLPPGNLTPLHPFHSAERAFISIPGIVNIVAGSAQAQSKSGVQDIFCRIQPGDPVVFPTNNVEKCGNIISRAETRNQAVTTCEEAIRTITILLKPGTKTTEIFLFGKQEADKVPIRAFKLEQAVNLAALKSMPFYREGTEPGEPDNCLPCCPLPCLAAETSRDWHGNTLEATLTLVSRFTDEQILKLYASGSIKLGKIFWYAVLKGGYQGGIYCLETLAEFLSNREKFKDKVEAWTEYL